MRGSKVLRLYAITVCWRVLQVLMRKDRSKERRGRKKGEGGEGRGELSRLTGSSASAVEATKVTSQVGGLVV